VKSPLHIVHSDPACDKHLEGMSETEIKFIRNLASAFVDSVLKKVDENSVSVHKKIKRRSI
jgi:hypothetical protein